jgi:hypothetical protein
MKISRRQFFSGLGGLVAVSGLSRFKIIDSAIAGEPKKIGNGLRVYHSGDTSGCSL